MLIAFKNSVKQNLARLLQLLFVDLHLLHLDRSSEDIGDSPWPGRHFRLSGPFLHLGDNDKWWFLFHSVTPLRVKLVNNYDLFPLQPFPLFRVETQTTEGLEGATSGIFSRQAIFILFWSLFLGFSLARVFNCVTHAMLLAFKHLLFKGLNLSASLFIFYYFVCNSNELFQQKCWAKFLADIKQSWGTL